MRPTGTSILRSTNIWTVSLAPIAMGRCKNVRPRHWIYCWPTEAKEVLVKKPAGWAGGIVYAVGSCGVGVPGLLNRELEAAFGVRMTEIYQRASKVKELLGADLPSPSEDVPMPAVFTLRDEANAICAYAFRNGSIEDIHADGRISDEEMKRLMIQASEMLAKLLAKKHDLPAEYQQFIRDYHRKYCRKWER